MSAAAGGEGLIGIGDVVAGQEGEELREEYSGLNLLTDARKKEFLAHLTKEQATAWAQVCFWYEQYWVFCKNMEQVSEGPDEDYWASQAREWEGLIVAWERELLLSTSIGGRRAEQLVKMARGKEGEGGQTFVFGDGVDGGEEEDSGGFFGGGG